MADEFVLQLRVATNAMNAATCQMNGFAHKEHPIVVIPWCNKDICLAMEALWAMYASMQNRGIQCTVECHENGAFALYAMFGGAKVQIYRELAVFAQQISATLAWARSGWQMVNAATLHGWPFYRGSFAKTVHDTLPARLGRQIVLRHAKTHVLLVHRASARSKLDVFWRLFSKSFGMPGEPQIWFGRVQYDMFYALVDFAVWEEFRPLVLM